MGEPFLLSISILENPGGITGKIFWVVGERCAFGEERNLRQRRKGWNGVSLGSGIFQSHPGVAWMGHPLFPVLELGLSESAGDGL